MKYKILLIGMNRAIIDDFFMTKSDDFECFTSSLRFSDLMNHVKYLNPNILIYCLNNEVKENIQQMVSLKHQCKDSFPLAIIGTPEECDEFSRIAINAGDLFLWRPITQNTIQEKIIAFLSKRQEEHEKLMEQLRLEEEARKAANTKKRILVIDDDMRMLKLIKEQLHETYDVATALNGKLGLKFLGSKHADLILLDYEMPEENGPAVLVKIRDIERLKNIPVLFLTGITERDKIQQALSLKPQGYLLKPIDREKLLTTIESFIG